MTGATLDWERQNMVSEKDPAMEKSGEWQREQLGNGPRWGHAWWKAGPKAGHVAGAQGMRRRTWFGRWHRARQEPDCYRQVEFGFHS